MQITVTDGLSNQAGKIIYVKVSNLVLLKVLSLCVLAQFTSAEQTASSLRGEKHHQ